jgi:NADPH2:quinone reductase
MKAIRIHEVGGPEVLKYEDVELPPPGAGQVRVKHSASGVNFIDTYHRTGFYKMPLPAILGSEAAGIVEALGAGVTTLKVGDRVAYAMTPGAYAEENNVPAEKLVKVPAGVSDETAAAVLLKGMTAQYLLKRTYVVKSGETILVHAAAGATGSLLAQWGKHLGATVIGTVGPRTRWRKPNRMAARTSSVLPVKIGSSICATSLAARACRSSMTASVKRHGKARWIVFPHAA